MNKKIYVSQLFSDDEAYNILKNNNIGIEIIEFGIGYVLDKEDNGVADYIKRMGSLIQNKSISIHGPFLDLNPASYDSLIKEATLQRYNQSYHAAKVLGADRIVFHSCYLDNIYYRESYIDNSISFWKEFLKDKNDNIKIHIENVYDKEPSHLIEIVDKVNNENFSVCLDIGHVNCYGIENLESWIKKLGKRIGHLHLHNNDGLKDTHSGLKNGSINIENILYLIDNYCNEPAITIEVNNMDEIKDSVSLLLSRYY